MVWQLDPTNTTPYYNLALCQALAAIPSTPTCQVRYLTTPSLYEEMAPAPGVTISYPYRTGLNRAQLQRSRRLRRFVRGLAYPLGHAQVIAALLTRPPDLLHIQWLRLPLLDRWLAQAARRRGVPVVHTVHDVVPLFNPLARLGALAQIYAQAQAILLHTEADRAAFLAQFPGVAAQRAHVIRHLAPLAATLPVGANPTVARASLGIPLSAPTLAFCGTIRHYKGLHTLADAWPLILRRQPAAWLIVAGQPEFPADARALQRIRHLPQTVIHDWYLPSAELWRYHLAADLVLFPYHHVYTSGALISAMQFGRPVVATTVGGLPETVAGNGWLVPPRDPVALADAVLDALADPVRLADYGRRSAELVTQRHAPALIAAQTFTLYQALT